MAETKKDNTNDQEFTPQTGAALVNNENKTSEDPSTTKKNDYVVLDVVLYYLTDSEKGSARRFPQGSVISLTEHEAENLLAEPRPSIRLKDDNEEK